MKRSFVLMFVISCGGGSHAPATSSSEPSEPATKPVTYEALCEPLQKVLESASQDFVPLLGEKSTDNVWVSSVVPEGSNANVYALKLGAMWEAEWSLGRIYDSEADAVGSAMKERLAALTAGVSSCPAMSSMTLADEQRFDGAQYQWEHLWTGTGEHGDIKMKVSIEPSDGRSSTLTVWSYCAGLWGKSCRK